MLKIIKYELKKHFKSSIFLFIILLAFSFYTSYNYDHHAENIYDSINIVNLYIELINSLFLIGYLVYLGYDFTNTLLGGEKYFIFNIPINTIKILIGKVISISLLTGLMQLPAMFTSIYRYNKYLSDPTIQIQPLTMTISIKELVSFYSFCLMVLMLTFLIIVISKNILEKIKFKFLWLVPLAVIVSIYLDSSASILNSTLPTEIFLLVFNLKATIIHFLISFVFLLITAYIIDKKIDF